MKPRIGAGRRPIGDSCPWASVECRAVLLPPNHMPDTGFLSDYLFFWYVLLSLAALTAIWIRRARRVRRWPCCRSGGWWKRRALTG